MSFFPLLVTSHFGGGALQLAWIYSSYGLGLVVGGVVVSIWGGLKRGMATSALGGVNGIAWLVVGLVPPNGYWLALASIVFYGLLDPARVAGLRAAQQKVVPAEMQGRYWAISQSLNQVMGPISLAISAPLVGLWGVRYIYILVAATQLASSLMRRFVPELYYIEDRLAPAPAKTEAAELELALEE